MLELKKQHNDICSADMQQDYSVDDILNENASRLRIINAPFNPFTGESSIGERKRIDIMGFPIPVQYLPVEMLKLPIVKGLKQYGLDAYTKKVYGAFTTEGRNAILDTFLRIRYKYDFPFWCWMLVKIKPKGSGDDIPFRLNYPQRKLVSLFEDLRKGRIPIRVVLLKARQWGGSTVTQIYIAWLQLVHMLGANSIIVGHVKDASTEVKDMYFKLIDKYPVEQLYAAGAAFNAKAPKIHGTSSSANLFYIDSRNCKLKLGSAERPESARGGDSTLAHCTEVAMWVATEGKAPEDIVRSVTGGISYKPNTMIVYESTANGTDNFFHDEYVSAKEAQQVGAPHQFYPLFISWYEIGWKNMLPFAEDTPVIDAAIRYGEAKEKGLNLPYADPYLPDAISPDAMSIRDFAQRLLDMREQSQPATDREESGRYYWWLWQQGATLQALYWYMVERTKFHDHADMAAEAPSDDIEAFKHSGAKVFSEYYIHQLESGCRQPRFIGEVETTLMMNAEDFKRYQHRPNDAFSGRQLLSNLSFREDKQGSLWIWELPETFNDCKIKNRYLVTVDIGGMSNKADFSVIMVLDRYWMMEGGKPTVVAQWYGHIDHDILAWKAAQIAKFYDNALLVIESNTLETRDRDRDVDGDQSQFILNQIKESYPNLYERTESQEAIVDGMPHRYGFHTNTNTKPMIIANLNKVLREHLYIERDKRCLDEYMVYEKKQNGSFGAAAKHHDDLLMTRAISLFICYNEMEMPRVMEKSQKALQRPSTQISSAII